jgi:hypothetical protein
VNRELVSVRRAFGLNFAMGLPAIGEELLVDGGGLLVCGVERELLLPVVVG